MDLLDKDFLINFFYLSLKEVERRKEDINKLNVFPVPDGDTGTNMLMTLQSSWEEINKIEPKKVGDVSEAITKGSLMGARGNSGVIMSQIFKGMNIVLKDKEFITIKELSLSLIEGVSKAYKAVIKPVEGTILTVSKAFAKSFYEEIKSGKNFEEAYFNALKDARETLKKTPEMLSILKEAGVVDAGGLGFLVFMEGGFKAITKREVDMEKIVIQEAKLYQKLKYPYDVVILLKTNFDEDNLFKDFNLNGDSLIIGKEENLIKIHYHTDDFLKLIDYFLKKGSLVKVNVENMQFEVDQLSLKEKDVGFISVSRGEGFKKILKNVGVDEIVNGGQTFNPSTKDILDAIEKVNAKNIVIFPNNSNVIFSAIQTKELTNKRVEVIPTKSIPECISSLTMIDKNLPIDDMVKEIENIIKNIRTIEVTKSIRDTKFNGATINKGDYISIYNDRIYSSKASPEEAAISSLKNLEIEDGSLITIYYGEEIDEKRAYSFKEELEKIYPNCDIEIYFGGQPLYYYIISLEWKMIKIVVDSSCDLPDDFIKEKDIKVIPLYLKIGDKFYKDGVDIKSEEFVELLKKEKNLSTSQPPLPDFINTYKTILEKGDEILSIHITGKGSGTFNSAKIAKEEMDSEKIDVLDSENISIGYGFIVKKVVSLLEKGMSKKEILSKFKSLISKVYLVFTLNTLQYVYKGGRVNDIKGLILNVLDIKPILHMKDGLPRIYKIIRGRGNSIKELNKIVNDKIKKVKENYELAFIHLDAKKEIEELKNSLLSNLKPKYHFTKIVGSALGVHAGPGALGVAINFLEEWYEKRSKIKFYWTS